MMVMAGIINSPNQKTGDANTILSIPNMTLPTSKCGHTLLKINIKQYIMYCVNVRQSIASIILPITNTSNVILESVDPILSTHSRLFWHICI